MRSWGHARALCEEPVVARRLSNCLLHAAVPRADLCVFQHVFKGAAGTIHNSQVVKDWHVSIDTPTNSNNHTL